MDEKFVLRSIYLDTVTDAELVARAEDDGTTRAELIRRFIAAGLGRPDIIGFRDALLESLRAQFATKVSKIELHGSACNFDAFLTDLANNLAQGTFGKRE